MKSPVMRHYNTARAGRQRQALGLGSSNEPVEVTFIAAEPAAPEEHPLPDFTPPRAPFVIRPPKPTEAEKLTAYRDELARHQAAEASEEREASQAAAIAQHGAIVPDPPVEDLATQRARHEAAKLAELPGIMDDLVRRHTLPTVIDAAWEAGRRLFKPARAEGGRR